jgi:hypothetical protein
VLCWAGGAAWWQWMSTSSGLAEDEDRHLAVSARWTGLALQNWDVGSRSRDPGLAWTGQGTGGRRVDE